MRTDSSSLELDDLVQWERKLASVFRVNPYTEATFEREFRRLSRELQEGAGRPAQILADNREALVQHWIQYFAPIAQHFPPLWQSIYFGLARFALDPQLEEELLRGTRLEKCWNHLDTLGKEYNVPEHRNWLGIAERARRATRALRSIRGYSSETRQLKYQIWQACFGSDLRKLMVYETLLREQNVLILGPTGSGKELVAQVLLQSSSGYWVEKNDAIHWKIHHNEALNLAEFPRELMAAQIVGYKRGAYTGASQDFQGVLSRCHQGAVFLDEVGELPIEGQVVLLRALETKRIRPLGSPDTDQADCRVIAATHNPLDNPHLCEHFRRDLFYRLAGSIIRVPGLAERREDIPAIALGFLDSWNLKAHASLYLEDPIDQIKRYLSHEAFQTYAWPGNVRELKRIATQILMGSDPFAENIEPTDYIPDTPQQTVHDVMNAHFSPQPSVPSAIQRGEWTMEELRLWYIHHMLELVEGRQKEAAQRLKIHRTTIYHATKKEQPESSQ